MRRRACFWTGIAGVVAGLAGSCGGTFVCTEDSNCDLSSDGRCVDGACVYSPTGATSTGTGEPPTSSGEPTTADTTAPTSGATASASTSGATVETTSASTSGATVETTSASATGTTGEPVDCKEWEVLLDEPGKATGVVQLPGGDAVVVGVSYAGKPHVLAKRLPADDDETVKWSTPIVETIDKNYAQDIDLVARVFKSDAETMLIAYSIRKPDLNGDPKQGPYLARVAVEDGALLTPTSETLGVLNRSLRDAVMPDPDTILFAGEEGYEAWYTRAGLQGDPIDEKWKDPIEPLDGMDSTIEDPERAQAIVALSDAALVGGTWDKNAVKGEQGDFHAWLRLVDYDSGQEPCTCTAPGAGVLALAVTSNGQVFIGGFRQTTQSALWLARAETVKCPLTCNLATVTSEAGGNSTEFEHAERVEDAVLALHPLASGGVIAGGTLDGKPWLGRFTDGGQKLVWNMEPSMEVSTGAVLAIAVSDDDRCVTVAGSENYRSKDLAERKWWVRRLKLG